MNCQSIILAAGRSTRFNTGRLKLVEPMCGQPMILYPLDAMATLQIPTTLVVGHEQELIRTTVSAKYPATQYIEQTEQRGTGHAIAVTRDAWHADYIVICNGDAPLVTPELIERLYQTHIETKAVMTLTVAHNIDPLTGNYGRIMQQDGQISIVEASDFKGDPYAHTLINAGIYLLSKNFLQEFIDKLPVNQISGEIYFTDLAALASNAGHVVATVETPFDTIRGVNTVKEFWIAEQIKKCSLINKFMENGVRFDAPATNNLAIHTSIGRGTIISNGVQLLGHCVIGSNCTVEPFAVLRNATLHEGVTIKSHCVIQDAEVAAYTVVAPFTYMYGTTTHSITQDAAKNTAKDNFIGAIKTEEQLKI